MNSYTHFCSTLWRNILVSMYNIFARIVVKQFPINAFQATVKIVCNPFNSTIKWFWSVQLELIYWCFSFFVVDFLSYMWMNDFYALQWILVLSIREEIDALLYYVISAKSSTLWTLMFNLSPRVNHKFSITGGVASLYIVTVSSNVLSNISTARTVMSALSPSDQTKFKYSDSSFIFRTDLNALKSFTDEPSLTVYDTRKSTQPVGKTWYVKWPYK